MSYTQKQADTAWSVLRSAISEIEDGNARSLRYEDLYRHAYDLVLNKHGSMLYTNVKECIQTRLEGVRKKIGASDGDALTTATVAEFKEHRLIMRLMADVLIYMDKSYCVVQKIIPVYDLGMNLFREMLVIPTGPQSAIRTTLNNMIEQDRKGGPPTNRPFIAETLNMLVELGVRSTSVYVDVFEKSFIDATKKFYRSVSAAQRAANPVKTYVSWAESIFEAEKERFEVFLHSSSEANLTEALNCELVAAHAKDLVEDEKSGGYHMMENDEIENLRALYILLERDSVEPLRLGMSTYITGLGERIKAKAGSEANTFVKAVLDLRSKFSNIVDRAFRGDRNFARIVKDSLAAFINGDKQAALYMARYVDIWMQNRTRASISNAAMHKDFNAVITIFRYLKDKDVFEELYRRTLSSRLLSRTSFNFEAEKVFIKKLKTECGQQYTSRLEGMFKDVEASMKLNEAYKTSLRSEAKSNILNVTVLTKAFWPEHSVSECKLPPSVKAQADKFSRYYLKENPHRKLNWLHHRGTAEINAVYKSGPKLILVSTYQMVIMDAFTAKQTWTYADLLSATGIEPAAFNRHLLSLCHPSVQLLSKVPSKPTLLPTDKITFHYETPNPRAKLKVPLYKSKARPGTGAISAETKSDRLLTIKAQTARLMKARKKLGHSALVTQVIQALHKSFEVKPAMVKKSIDLLLKEGIIRRDEKSRKTYHFVAAA